MMSGIKTIFMLTSIAVGVRCSYAQWIPNPKLNNPVCSMDGEQRLPMIVSDGKDGAIIVWEDYRFATASASDIFAQRIGSDGCGKWVNDGVSVCAEVQTQRIPSLVSDGAGGTIIVWEDFRRGNADIFAQRIDSNGIVLWTQNGRAVCSAPWQERYPRVVSDLSGGAIIVWQDQRNVAYDIFAQRIDGDGNILWPLIGVPVCNLQQSHILQDVISDGNGGAYVTWEDGRNPGGGDIFAQHISASGYLLWQNGGLPICIAPGSQKQPRISCTKTGGIFITWMDFRNGASDADVYVQFVDATGTAQFGNGKPVCTASDNQESPSIISDGLSGAIIAWLDRRLSMSPRVFAQRVIPGVSGNFLWMYDGIVVSVSGTVASPPVLAEDGAGGVLLAWQDNRNGKDNMDVYAQRIDYASSPQWLLSGVPICTADGRQSEQQIVSIGNSGAIVTWRDNRNPADSGDIYASNVSLGGTIPVNLSAFTASLKGSVVHLGWTTEREESNAGFEIQRSDDGIMWESIGYVAGKGNAVEKTEYAFLDDGIDAVRHFHTLFYRLKQIDFDGSITFSRVREVRIPVGDFTDVEIGIFPNPVTTHADITFLRGSPFSRSVKLYDLFGKLVRDVSPAGCTMRIDVRQLPTGMYVVHAVADGKRVSRMITVLH